MEWSRDPRCVVKYGTLALRVAQQWDPEEALTSHIEHRERNYKRPAPLIEAFGEVKSPSEWAKDERVTVRQSVFLRRIQHGWPNESALTTNVNIAREKRDSSEPIEALGESKTLHEWAKDERCEVSAMTLRKNLQSGLPMEEAFKFKRRPGRHFLGSYDEFCDEVDSVKTVLGMMQEGGELWVYAGGADPNRISLIHQEIRHTIAEDLFQQLFERNLIAPNFETDTIRNFELTPAGRAATG